MQDITFIRHAPVDHRGRLYGRLDWPAVVPDTPPPVVPEAAAYLTSPALRCRQTADWLAPTRNWQLADPLWEQDFGETEGTAYRDLPDLGPLTRSDLAAYRPAGGESFMDMAVRVSLFLHQIKPLGDIVVVAHAGVIRAALGQALGDMAAGLAFEIDPLSRTTLRRYDTDWGVVCVNRGL